MTAMRAVLAAVVLSLSTSAQACGVCTEDKVAATYDHAIAAHAASRGRTMVFGEVRGHFDARRLKTAATRVKGLDPASLRTSTNPATLSFALDRRRLSVPEAVARLQAMVPAGTQLVILHRQNGSASLRAAPATR